MSERYQPRSPEAWLQQLAKGKYSSVSAAKKSVGQMKTWSEKEKARGYALIEKYFSAPARFKETFYGSAEVEKVAAERLSAPEVPAPLAAPSPPVLLAAQAAAEAATKAAALDRALERAQSLSASLRATIEVYRGLRDLNPKLDVSQSMALLVSAEHLSAFLEKLSDHVFLSLPAAEQKQATPEVVDLPEEEELDDEPLDDEQE